MREDACKVLGVKSDATPDEIKRAYFRLIRQHTPDRDPEEFQKIRRAYETLRDAEIQGKEENSVNLEIPTDPMGKKMMDQIVKCYQMHDYELAIATAQEAMQHFGQCTGYLYYLALAQRNAGYTGKSVRNLELLVERKPEVPAFRRELALSLQERGFGKKAMAAFETAYRMGCRDDEFIQMYSICCSERQKPELGLKLLTELADNAGRKTASRPLDYLEVYVGILCLSLEISDESFRQAADRFVSFIHQAGTALEDCMKELTEMLFTVSAVCAADAADGQDTEWKQMHDRVNVSRDTARQAVASILAAAGHTVPDEEEMWRKLQEETDMIFLVNDADISISLRRAADAFCFAQETDDQMYLRFIQLDSRLCLLEEWPGNRKEFQILRERYPVIYEHLEEFIQKLEQTSSPERLRETMLKDYARLSKYYEGFYFQMYPHRMPGKEKQVWKSDQEGTFRRMGKKTGRNDPCPCGSGEKYKNCCGRNSV